jgi:hypothetical protein
LAYGAAAKGGVDGERARSDEGPDGWLEKNEVAQSLAVRSPLEKPEAGAASDAVELTAGQKWMVGRSEAKSKLLATCPLLRLRKRLTELRRLLSFGPAKQTDARRTLDREQGASLLDAQRNEPHATW